jgi:hypothetical protein
LNFNPSSSPRLTSSPPVQASCGNQFQKCTLTVSGEIENMLVDGASVAGNATVSAWMQDGHGYASSKLAGDAPIPWTILFVCSLVPSIIVGAMY